MADSEQRGGRGGLGYEEIGQATEQDYLSDLAAHYRDRLLKEANLEKLTELPPEVMRAKVESLVSAMIREEQRIISTADRARLITFVTNEAAGYGPLDPLLRDPSITEIMVNGPNEIYIERGGMLQRRSDVFFHNQDHIRHIVDRIVSPLGRRVDESSPMVDARLPDGSRVNVIIPPLSLNGPVLTIRRFRRQPLTAEDLVRFGSLSQEMMDFLRACVIAKLNILITGGTGSGKTSLLNVLAAFIPGHERIITIEDAAELQFWRVHPHVLRQEARPPNVEGKGEVTIRQLLRNSLRMRPNRIVVGEARGAEALDMLQAMNTGHEGSMTTVHANSPYDALSRLETMVMWAGTELPSAAIREQLVAALNIVVQQDRMSDGTRKLTRISEIQGVKHERIVLRDIFIFDMIGLDEGGQVMGNHTPTGIIPKALPRLKIYNVEPDRKIFVPAYLVAEMGADMLRDQKITEIMVNGPNQVYVEQNGRLVERPDIRFRDETHLLNVINTIVAPLGRIVDEDHPMVDARLPDGSRVNAVLKPIGLEGPFLTIRRFPDVPLTVEKLVEYGSLDERIVEFLRGCVVAKLSILISGGTDSGKTTLLNVLSAFIPSHERIVTIEDSAELQLHQPHVVRLEARPPDEDGEGEITIRDLVRNTLRMRPDRIIVGEVRGAEALDMLQAMNTGHEGSMTTVHANSPHDSFSRLETMVMWADVPLPSSAIREQMTSAIHVVIQQNHMIDGSRKIAAVSEVGGVDGDGHIILHDIFKFEPEGLDKDGKVLGSFVATGYLPTTLERMATFGVTMPKDIFQPQKKTTRKPAAGSKER
jgi:pilus assembly protein CpaF